jgi:hypothetical protein
MCTAACEQTCPDQPGHPTTFCVDAADLPAGAAPAGEGRCVSRCDYGYEPIDACRPNYGCAFTPRHTEPSVIKAACLPGVASELGPCVAELAERGAVFEPTYIAPSHPIDAPELTCSVEEPVMLRGPVAGLELLGSEGDDEVPMLVACEAAHSLWDTAAEVRPSGVRAIRHLGAYNCRTIAGTSSLSRHGMGDAVDIFGFDFEDGSSVSYVEDWEHDTLDFSSSEAEWLYNHARTWYIESYWNIVLTPNYNAAHDNHVHADLTPGGDSFHRSTGVPLGD